MSLRDGLVVLTYVGLFLLGAYAGGILDDIQEERAEPAYHETIDEPGLVFNHKRNKLEVYVDPETTCHYVRPMGTVAALTVRRLEDGMPYCGELIGDVK